jgi:hypothetical protein
LKSTFNYHPILDKTAKNNFASSRLAHDKADSERLVWLQGGKKLDRAYDGRVGIFTPLRQSCENLIENYYTRNNRSPGEMPGQTGMISADRASNYKVHVIKFKQHSPTLSRDRACFRRGDFESFDLFLDLVSEAGRADTVDDAMIERERKRDHLGRFIFVIVWNQFAVRGTDEKRAD